MGGGGTGNHRDIPYHSFEGVVRWVTALWTSSSSSRPEVCLQIKEKRQSRTWVWGAFTRVCLLIAIFSSASPGIVTREDHISLHRAHSLRSLASFSYQTVSLVTVQLSEMIIFLPRTEFCTALLLRTELIVTEGQIRNEIICPSAYYSTLSSLTERTYKLFVNPGGNSQ